jgi:hypothetical protein
VGAGKGWSEPAEWGQIQERARSLSLPIFPDTPEPELPTAFWPDDLDAEDFFGVVDRLQPAVLYVTAWEIGFVATGVYHCLRQDPDTGESESGAGLTSLGRRVLAGQIARAGGPHPSDVESLGGQWIDVLCQDDRFVRANSPIPRAEAACAVLGELTEPPADESLRSQAAAYARFHATNKVRDEIRPARIRDAEHRLEEHAVELSRQPGFQSAQNVEERKYEARRFLAARLGFTAPTALTSRLAREAKTARAS